MGFLVVKTGDSTCHPRDNKEDYLYRTILGFTKHFSGINKQLETCLVKMSNRQVSKTNPIGNPPQDLTKALHHRLSYPH